MRRRQRLASPQGCPRLCQGLVVPPGSDCVLALRPAPRRDNSCAVDISDLRGKPVLKAFVTRPHNWGQVDENILQTMGWNFSHVPAIRLCMLDAVKEESKGKGPSPLAICHCGGSDGRPAMFFYDSDGRFFGSLAKARGQTRYVFTTVDRERTLSLDGIFADHAVCISNPSQQRMAETEPCRMAFDLQNEFYRLRCSGAVDVGLVICCLLSIDEMEAFAPSES